MRHLDKCKRICAMAMAALMIIQQGSVSTFAEEQTAIAAAETQAEAAAQAEVENSAEQEKEQSAPETPKKPETTPEAAQQLETTPETQQPQEPETTPEAQQPQEPETTPEVEQQPEATPEAQQPEATPEAQPTEEAQPAATATATPTPEAAKVQDLTYNAAGVQVKVHTSTAVAADTQLIVTPVNPDDFDNAALNQWLNDKQVADAAIYDIHLADAGGNEISVGQASVSLNFSTPVVAQVEGLKTTLSFLHIANGSTVEIGQVNAEGTSASITANGFSPFVFVRTAEHTEQQTDGETAIDLRNAIKNVAITEVDGQAYDSNKKYPRGAKIKFNLSYKFAEDAKPTANGTKSATYALPAGLNFTNTSGNIICEGYTAGPAGTYTIVDGVVTFIYTKEFLKAHPSDIEGSFSFEGALSESANENKDKVDIIFDGPGKTIPIEIKFEDGKISGGKSYKFNDDGTIDFTIELNVTGKDVTNLVLKDMQGSNLKFADNPEFKLNGTAIDSSKITLGTDDSATLNLGDLKIGKYQLTYKARVEDKTIISGDANKNRAEWSWTGGTGSAETTVNGIEKTLKKSGSVSKNGNGEYEITWTVIYIPGTFGSAAGKTFVDTLGPDQEYIGDYIVYYDENGNKDWVGNTEIARGTIGAGNSFSYTFPSDKTTSKGGYKLVYKTKVTKDLSDLVGKEQFTNSIQGDGKTVSGTAEIEKKIPSMDIVTKKGTADQGSRTATWTVTVDSKGKTVKNLVVVDELQDSYNWKGKYNDDIVVKEGNNILTAGTDYIIEPGVSSSNNPTLTIRFTKDISDVVTITYSSEYSESDKTGSTGNKIHSTYTVDNKEYAEDDGSNVEFKSTDFVVDKSGDISGGIANWKVTVNKQLGWERTELTNSVKTITDEIPEGMEYVDGSLKCKIDQSHWNGDNAEPYANISVSYDKDSRKLTVNITGLELEKDPYIYIELSYQTKIVQLPIESGEGTVVEGDKVSFTNTVKIGNKEDHATVEVSNKSLNKSGIQVKNLDNVVEYSIGVNYSAADLMPDGDTLTLEDVLDANLTLDTSSIKVTDMVTGENVDYQSSFGTSADGRNVMTLTIPDGRALNVVYRATLVSAGKTDGTQYEVANKATLRGGAEKTVEIKTQVKYHKSNATIAGRSDSITIKKVDQNGNSLKDAKFVVQAVNAETLEPVDNDSNKTDVTNSSGLIKFEGLHYNTLYYYQEVEAPEGYSIKDKQVHYFIIKNVKDNAAQQEFNALIRSIPEGTEYAALSGGQTFIVENQKKETEPVTAQIQVEKIVSGEGAPKGENFIFTITGVDGAPMPASTSIQVTAGETKSFGEISYTKEGTYKYTVKETPGTTEGMSYVVDGYAVEVKVTKVNEKLTADIIYPEKSASADKLTVENTYSKPKGSLTIHKTVAGLSDADQKANAGKPYKFTVKGSDNKYYAADGTVSDTEVVVEIRANKSRTINNLPVGNYTVSEVREGTAIANYGLTVTGEGDVTVEKDKSVTATVTNTYSKDKGSLKISKTVIGLSDADQKGNADKTYKFTVKGSDNKYYAADGTASDTEVVLEIKAGASLTIENLPVGDYTVTEVKADAAIETYGLTVEGEGKVTVVKDETATAEVINTYSKDKGSLTISKTVTGLSDADQKANADKTYTFTVKGSDDKYYKADGTASNTEVVLEIKAGASLTIENLPVGDYTVTEVKADAAIETYGLTVTGEGKVTVVKDETAAASVTNTYSKDKGSLKISKTVTGLSDADQKGNADKTYKFTVKGSDNKYYVADGTASDTEVVLGIKANESLTIANLPVGTYTVEEKQDDAAIETYGLSVEGTGSVIIKKNETATAEVTNTYSKDKGSLTISKKVAGLSDADQKGNADKTYKFTVKGSDNKYYAADGTASDTEVVLEIKAGASLTIENLPVGDYTVTEVKADAAIETYGLTVTGEGKVTVVKDETATASVTNTYSKDKGSLKISKKVAGLSDADQKGNADKTYKFTVKGSDNKYYAADGTASDTEVVLEIKAGASLTIENLPVGDYTVTEVKADAAIETYGLTVTGEGKVTVVKDETATAEVINTYSKDKGSLTISKTVTGLSDADQKANADKTYTFTVKGSDDKYYKADGTASNTEVVLEIKAGASLTIENLPVGDYTVTEVKADAAIETYGLTVTGEGKVTVVKDETAAASVTNTYSKDKGSLKISKTVTGLSDADQKGNADKTYKFTVKGSDNKYYVADGTASDTEVVLGIKANESLTIANLPVGTYTVEEKQDDAAIETYGLSVEGTGSVIIKKNETATAEVTNTYSKDKGSLTISKAVTGLSDVDQKANADKIYKFTVKGSDDKYYKADGTTSNTEVVLEIKAGASLTIENLPVGDYTVTEVKADAAIETYGLTVTGEGKVIVVKDETATAEVTNTYSKDKGSLKISKAVTGLSDADQKANADKIYKFTVKGSDNKYYAADGTASGTEVVLEIKANESLTIANLPVGTYTVEEKQDDAAIETYGLSVEGTGSVIIKKNETATAEVINTYSKDKGSLKISKTVTGLSDADQKANADKTYTFTVKGSDDKYYKADGTTSNTEVVLEIKAGASLTIANLPVGTYTVEEKQDDAAIETYGLSVEGTGTVTIKKDETATATVTNTYSKDKGSLTISKAVTGLSDADKEANKDKTYKFTVKGSDDKYYAADGTASDTEVVLGIKANESLTIANLPVGTYTVEEKQDDAAIETYGLSVEGTGTVTIKKDETATASVTNTYSKDKGSLTISKKVTGLSDADQKANADKTYKFTVKGSDDKYYKADGTASDTEVVLEIKAGASLTIANLPVGTYTVEEKQDDAAIETYGLSVEGTGTVTIKKDETATASVTNTYSKDKGSLTISKTVSGLSDADKEANKDKTYKFTVKGSDDKYYAADGTASDTEVVLEIKAGASLTIANLPVGEYTVEEVKEDASMEGYDLTATGEGTVTVRKDETAVADVTNTFELIPHDVVLTKTDIGGKELAGAKFELAGVQEDGVEIEKIEWISDGTSKTISLKPGTYTLEETAAPDGYNTIQNKVTFTVDKDGKVIVTESAKITVNGKEISEVSAEGNEITIKDTLKGSSITVTKNLVHNNQALSAIDATFYVALYNDEACTERVSEVKAIEFKNASASTASFTDVQVGKTYYVAECDEEGNALTSGTLAGATFLATFTQGNKATVEQENGSTIIYFTNEFLTIPDGFYKEGKLTITKKLLGVDGKAKKGTDKFYAGIFMDEELTELADADTVSANLVELDLNNASEASQTIKFGVANDETLTFYIAETDEDGNPVADDEKFSYKVTYSAKTATFDITHLSASVTIVNREKEETKKTITTTPSPNPSGTTSKTGVKTGDNTPILPFVAILLAAIAAIVVFVKKRFMSKKN